MKIALVSQEYPPETARGGIGTQTYAKAQGLGKLGHSIFVISRSTDNKRHESQTGNVCVIRIPGMENCLPEMTDPVQWLTHSVAVAAELESLHTRLSLDLIDFPEWAAEGYIYLLNRSPWKSVPVVIQLHGPLVMFAKQMGWPEESSAFYKVGTHMEATCLQLADAVYSSSHCSSKWIRDYYCPGIGEVPVLHLGVDTEHFSPQQRNKSTQPVIVFAGRVAKNKGIEELVNAVCNLASEFPGLKLKIIGQGDKKLIEKLQEKGNLLGSNNPLEFAGYIQKDQLPAEFSKADIFAAPSWYEGGPGFVYLEAMACGLPVVGCSGSGVDEIVIPGENGLLVPPKDERSLEAALRNLLSSPALIQEMGSKARRFVLEHADSKHCLDRLEAFYFSILETCQMETEDGNY